MKCARIAPERQRLIDNLPIVLVAGLFLCYLLWQHHYVYLYHDDYGYAALAYAYRLEGVAGQSFTLLQFLDYLRMHYLIWGGRVLYLGLGIILMRAGLPMLRLIQPILLTLLFLKAYRFSWIKDSQPPEDAGERPASGNRLARALTAAAGFAAFGMYPMEAYRTGIFWFTASVLYVFPIAVFFSAITGQAQLANAWSRLPNRSRWARLAFCTLGIFAAAFSQEQISVMVVTFLFLEGMQAGIYNRRIQAIYIVPFAAALAGAAILFLAPGNHVRMQTDADYYALPLIERAGRNLSEAIRRFTSLDSSRFLVLILIITLIAAIRIRLHSRLLSALIKLHLIVTVASVTVLVLSPAILQPLVERLRSGSRFMIAFFGFYSLLSALLTAAALVQTRNQRALSLMTAALASLAVMLNTPYVIERMVIPFLFACSVALMALLKPLLLGPPIPVHQKAYRLVRLQALSGAQLTALAVTLLILTLGISGMSGLLNGYRGNTPVLEQNAQVLRQAADDITAGTPIHLVRVQRLNPEGLKYAGDQPYTDGFSYIDFYIREYYNIPQDVQLEWSVAS